MNLNNEVKLKKADCYWEIVGYGFLLIIVTIAFL